MKNCDQCGKKIADDKGFPITDLIAYAGAYFCTFICLEAWKESRPPLAESETRKIKFREFT